jgi:hypothetical protein
MWRCPHCGTPQAETARCWVCRRSSTACGTCRNFRHSVAGSLGYCGLDRGRQPLVGDEIRACWEAWPAGAEPVVVAPGTVIPVGAGTSEPDRAQPLAVVEVRDASAAGPPALPDEPPGEPGLSDGLPAPIRLRDEPGWSLWGELDR